MKKGTVRLQSQEEETTHSNALKDKKIKNYSDRQTDILNLHRKAHNKGPLHIYNYIYSLADAFIYNYSKKNIAKNFKFLNNSKRCNIGSYIRSTVYLKITD